MCAVMHCFFMSVICVIRVRHLESTLIELSTLKLVPEHNLDAAFIEYHNNEHAKNTRGRTNAGGNGS